MDLSLPLYAPLVSSPVEPLLARWQDGPAIFPDGRVPGEAAYPCCVIFAPVQDLPLDTKTEPGREVMCSIDFYGLATGDPGALDSLAEVGRAALHRKPVGVGTLAGTISRVDGPIVAPSDDHLYGRRLVVTLTLRDALAHA